MSNVWEEVDRRFLADVAYLTLQQQDADARAWPRDRFGAMLKADAAPAPRHVLVLPVRPGDLWEIVGGYPAAPACRHCGVRTFDHVDVELPGLRHDPAPQPEKRWTYLEAPRAYSQREFEAEYLGQFPEKLKPVRIDPHSIDWQFKEKDVRPREDSFMQEVLGVPFDTSQRVFDRADFAVAEEESKPELLLEFIVYEELCITPPSPSEAEELRQYLDAHGIPHTTKDPDDAGT